MTQIWIQMTLRKLDSLNGLAQSLVEYATLAASKAVSESDPGNI